MSNPLFGNYPDPAELAEPQDDEELVVDLLGEYLERRNGETSGQVLLAEFEARATAHGSHIREGLLEAVAYYEVRRLIWPDDVAGPQHASSRGCAPSPSARPGDLGAAHVARRRGAAVRPA